jgi:hypothetical protein
MPYSLELPEHAREPLYPLGKRFAFGRLIVICKALSLETPGLAIAAGCRKRCAEPARGVGVRERAYDEPQLRCSGPAVLSQ